MITEKAYAKVNLTLDITGRRDDGYHLVRMVMQTLDIADVLTFERSNGKTEIILKSQGGSMPLEVGKDNLIYKAAELILDRYVREKDPEAGVRITLEKNIPIAAGMAGGSSDAAATLKGVTKLYELTVNDADLRNLGVTLGADVPYCIMGGTALSEGIGEELTRLPELPECWFVVAKPVCSVSTAEAYGGYDKLANSEVHIKHPDVDGQVDAIYKQDIGLVSEKLLNVLEYVTAEKHEEIGKLEKILKESGAKGALMSGSGPTVFGIFDTKEKADAAAAAVETSSLTDQLFVTRNINAGQV